MPTTYKNLTIPLASDLADGPTAFAAYTDSLPNQIFATTATALDRIHPADAHQLLTQLELVKENVRNAIQTAAGESRKEQRYG